VLRCNLLFDMMQFFVCCGAVLCYDAVFCVLWCGFVLRCSLLYDIMQFFVCCGKLQFIVLSDAVLCVLWCSFVLRCNLLYAMMQYLYVVVQFDVYCGADLCYGAVCCII